jgi:hypothetical protein
MTQTEKIERYIKEHGSITTMEAFQYLRITRLSARIEDMRDKGIDVVSTPVNNKGMRYVRYSIKKRGKKNG